MSNVSQTCEAQTAVPTCGLQSPFSVGVWPAMVGSGVPFARSAVQVATGVAPVLQNCVPGMQFASVVQPVEHAPVPMQVLPAWVAPAAVQVVVPPTVPQLVQAAPPPGQ